MKSLYEELKQYQKSDYYGFHMPGHKRNETLTGADLPYGIDITEIEGFDDLHHAKGILKEMQEHTAQLFRAGESHWLINGSTAGILSAVMGCTKRNGKILIARNCHKSVYHAIELNELYARYLYPEMDPKTGLNGEIKAEQIREELVKNGKEIQAVMITSPTYDGVVSDIKSIAEVVHEFGIPLIVDEAHGSHFGFHSYFPKNANQLGADVVIHSVHKTLPAPTQTAVLHMNGDIADREAIRKYLHIFQTSSPSYILMSGIDACIKVLEEKSEELFSEYVKMLKNTRDALGKMRHLQIEETSNFDRSKIIISTKNTAFTGKQLYEELLKHYHLQMEMAAGNYVVAMTSIGDTEEGMERLVTALQEIDQRWCEKGRSVNCEAIGTLPEPEQVYRSSDIWDQRMCNSNQRISVPWEEAIGQISMEYAYLYPPGIPLIVPGERISEEAVRQISFYHSIGFEIEGLKRQREIEIKKMGKIYYIMGKSSSGKDSIFKEIKKRMPELNQIVMYTTRPIREGEHDGVEYYFTDESGLEKLEKEGRVIELRAYNTKCGIWKYFTVNDGQIDLQEKNYLVIGTLESYAEMCRYFGKEKIVGVYIEVEDGLRLERALKREQQQENPKYAEMCRRFLADQEDFSEEKLEQSGIEKRFMNLEFETCVEEVCRYISLDMHR